MTWIFLWLHTGWMLTILFFAWPELVSYCSDNNSRLEVLAAILLGPLVLVVWAIRWIMKRAGRKVRNGF
jgi:hypothetical protein